MPNPSEQKPSHWAVALDSSEASRHTLTWAFQRLVRNEDMLTIITVLPGWKPDSHESKPDDKEDQATWTAQDLLAAFEKAYPEKQVETYYRIVKGDEDPRPAICQTAEKIDATMLILGSHGKSEGHRAIGHTVNNYCLDNSRVPVLVVRAD